MEKKTQNEEEKNKQQDSTEPFKLLFKQQILHCGLQTDNVLFYHISS